MNRSGTGPVRTPPAAPETAAAAAPATAAPAIARTVPQSAAEPPDGQRLASLGPPLRPPSSRADQPGFTAANAAALWEEALAAIETSLTGTLARSVVQVRAVDGDTLRLVFPASAALARRRCERPEHRGVIAAAVSAAAGRSLQLEFVAAAPPPPSQVAKEPRQPSPGQRMRELESHPLVQACIEQFEATIVRIDPPR